MAIKYPATYARHIRDCCVKVIECERLRMEGATPDSLLLDAVCRSLEIIGEAAGKVSSEFRR